MTAKTKHSIICMPYSSQSWLVCFLPLKMHGEYCCNITRLGWLCSVMAGQAGDETVTICSTMINYWQRNIIDTWHHKHHKKKEVNKLKARYKDFVLEGVKQETGEQCN